MLWISFVLKEELEVTLNYVDKNIMKFHVQMDSLSFFLSCIYGDSHMDRRGCVWKCLSRIGI